MKRCIVLLVSLVAAFTLLISIVGCGSSPVVQEEETEAEPSQITGPAVEEGPSDDALLKDATEFLYEFLYDEGLEIGVDCVIEEIVHEPVPDKAQREQYHFYMKFLPGTEWDGSLIKVTDHFVVSVGGYFGDWVVYDWDVAD